MKKDRQGGCWKGREAIWSGPVPLVGDTEEEGELTAQGSSLGSSRILGTLALGSATRKMRPLSWSGNQEGLPEGCRKLRLHLEDTCMDSLTPITVWRQQTENCLGLWLACQDHPSAPPRLYWAPPPVPLAWLLPTKAAAADFIELMHIWKELSPLRS